MTSYFGALASTTFFRTSNSFFTAGLAKFIYDLLLADLSESAVMAFLAAFIIWAVGLLADQNARLGLDRWVNPASRKD